VPLLAWGRLDTLGLSRASGVLLSQDTVEIVDAGHPLAAGMTGHARVYRGPGKLSWGAAGEGASVVARSLERGLPVVAHYPAGSMLPSGDRAPADRVLFFLAGDGLAPWLIAPEGYDLWLAAIDLLTGEAGAAGSAGAEDRAARSDHQVDADGRGASGAVPAPHVTR